MALLALKHRGQNLLVRYRYWQLSYCGSSVTVCWGRFGSVPSTGESAKPAIASRKWAKLLIFHPFFRYIEKPPKRYTEFFGVSHHCFFANYASSHLTANPDFSQGFFSRDDRFFQLPILKFREIFLRDNLDEATLYTLYSEPRKGRIAEKDPKFYQEALRTPGICPL